MTKRRHYHAVIALSVIVTVMACTRDYDAAATCDESQSTKTHHRTATIPLETALSELDAALDAIYPSTRGVARKTYSRENVSVCGGISTRSDSAADLPDTIVYVVNFDNSEGFAVLGAQEGMTPVYAITDNGGLDAGELDPFIMSEYYALQSMDIDFDAIDEAQDNICDCGYEGDDEDHECLDDDEVDDIIVDDEDIHKHLLGNSIATDMLILDRGFDQRYNIYIDPNDQLPPNKTVDHRVSTTTWQRDRYADPLLKTNWHQGAPFNNLCNGCPAGCVVIAVAQIMAYHEVTKDGELIFFGRPCSWDSIKSDLDGNSPTRDCNRQKALMCKDLGLERNCNVSYDTDGSGARATGAKRTLKNYGFQNVTKRTGFGRKNQNRAVAMILAGKPVYLGARGGGSGHAFVLDGFVERYREKVDSTFYTDGTYHVDTWHSSKQYMLHINWGWGGTHNGYFVLSDKFDTDNRYMKWDSDNVERDTIGSHHKYTWHFRMITYDI